MFKKTHSCYTPLILSFKMFHIWHNTNKKKKQECKIYFIKKNKVFLKKIKIVFHTKKKNQMFFEDLNRLVMEPSASMTISSSRHKTLSSFWRAKPGLGWAWRLARSLERWSTTTLDVFRINETVVPLLHTVRRL